MTAEATATNELAAYRARLTAHWDELTSTSGLRPDQEPLAATMEALGLDGLVVARAEMADLVRDEGILYGGESGRRWIIDPLPVILTAQEWDRLEAGLAQRARLLSLVLADIYGDQRLLSSGAIPAEIVWGHQEFLHQACGIPVPGETWLPLVATDLGRSSTGEWTVLGDRTGTPAGAGYAMANRRITSRIMGELHHDARPARLRSYFSAMRAALQQLAPRDGHTPRGVLMWSGASDATAYEQGFIATLLGYALVEAEDLVLRDGQVWINSPDGRELVDVILRRVASELIDPLEFRSDSQLGLAGLLEAARLGNVATVNPIGSGVLENPALLGLLPTLARQLLGEELLLPSAQTWWCGDDAARGHVLANLDDLLIKPIDRSRRIAPLPGRELDDATRADLRARIAAEPWAWCGQEPVHLSTAPVVTDDGLVPRRIVLRTFGVSVDRGHEFLPGGLARVAPDDRFTISNDADAIAKDVWVLDPEDAAETWATSFDGGVVAAGRASIAPRVADNLVWLGRYTERADSTIRLLRLCLDLARDHGRRPASRGAQVLAAMLRAGQQITGLDLGVDDLPVAHKRIRTAITEADHRGSVAHSLRRLSAAAHEVPDLMSGDLWHVLAQLDDRVGDAARRRDLAGVLDDLIDGTLALAGIQAESLTRDATWAFLDAGLRLERAQRMLGLVEATLGADHAAVVENQLVDAVLDAGESLITQRRRSAAGQSHRKPTVAATQLLVSDRSNPRAVAFQLDRLGDDLLLLGDDGLAGRVESLADSVRETDLAGHVIDRSLAPTLAQIRKELRGIADELSRTHLTRSAPRRAILSGWSDGGESS